MQEMGRNVTAIFTDSDHDCVDAPLHLFLLHSYPTSRHHSASQTHINALFSYTVGLRTCEATVGVCSVGVAHLNVRWISELKQYVCV